MFVLLLALLAAEPRVFALEGDQVRSERGDDDRPRPVGSLLKPFVAQAWASAHPGTATPVFSCGRRSGCWRPTGHGVCGLARALAVSCNAYFRALAAQVPSEALEATFAREGFLAPLPPTPDAAIGLAGGVLVRPSELLRAYRRLTREPWDTGEDVRREVLAGLRDAALVGTASGLGQHGFWAKTGTVPALDGRAAATSGWVVAVEDSGRTVLGLLDTGTGREAAAAIGRWLSGPRLGRGVPPAEAPVVRVALFGALLPRQVSARNVGLTPASSSRGFLGPGALVSLRPGDTLGDGLWELAPSGRGFVRRISGSVACLASPSGTLRIRAAVTPRAYVAGVLRAELAPGDRDGVVPLGAAVLRFLAAGPRHGSEDVCDSTHCSWFVGQGPRLLWPNPTRPIVEADAAGDPGETTWARIQAAAREPGPSYWSAHCGGQPLTPHFVWGNGDRRVWGCSRHGASAVPAWVRRFAAHEMEKAFGAPVKAVAVAPRAGVWLLRAETAKGFQELGYDEAHRRLAAVRGWSALPSPPDRFTRANGAFEARGVGRGHRVGLCLSN